MFQLNAAFARWHSEHIRIGGSALLATVAVTQCRPSNHPATTFASRVCKVFTPIPVACRRQLSACPEHKPTGSLRPALIKEDLT